MIESLRNIALAFFSVVAINQIIPRGIGTKVNNFCFCQLIVRADYLPFKNWRQQQYAGSRLQMAGASKCEDGEGIKINRSYWCDGINFQNCYF